jgi:hypothetical protein
MIAKRDDLIQALLRGGGARTYCACGRYRTRRCDFISGKDICHAPLCDVCAVPAGRDRDFCPTHHEQALCGRESAA